LSSGPYSLQIIDAVLCRVDTVVVLADTPPVSLQIVNQQAASCLAADGGVLLDVAGGTGPLQLQQNGQDIPVLSNITALAAGNYTYTLSDSLGCTDDVGLVISAGNCPIYVPNVFSPNLDGTNDYFAPQSVNNSATQILRMEVYDRWGGLIFAKASGLVDDPKYRWDGTRLGELMLPGVYVYFLEVQYAEGETGVISGDVLLLR
jgi:gliding motility-associated-like protein